MNSSIIKHRDILPIYVKGLYNHKYTLKQASESTGYSVVHLCRLRKQYEQYGAKIFEHGNKGRVSKFRIDTKLRQRIVCIYTASYSDVNFSYFQKCLKEFEGI